MELLSQKCQNHLKIFQQRNQKMDNPTQSPTDGFWNLKSKRQIHLNKLLFTPIDTKGEKMTLETKTIYP